MSIKGKAYIMGAFEHPTRDAPDKSTPQLHAECAVGALADAGLNQDDIDGYFCAGDAPGFGGLSMVDYMGLKNVRHLDSTETGGSSYILHVGHAAQAIAEGKCSVALITLAGRPRQARGGGGRPGGGEPAPEAGFENIYGGSTHNTYGMCAMRHMYEYGTTSEQLAWIKVAASHHAQWNEHAFPEGRGHRRAGGELADDRRSAAPPGLLRGHRRRGRADRHLARSRKEPESPKVKIMGAGEAPKGPRGGLDLDLTHSGAIWSGPRAFEEAGVKPADIKYASIYDSFTITVLMQLEDLGFCEKGQGGRFVSDGNLISGGVGKLPFNTDGGGLCNNHPTNRGGITKVIEAVRQLRGEAHPKVQVPNCDLAIAHGTGGSLGTRHGSATVIMEREG